MTNVRERKLWFLTVFSLSKVRKRLLGLAPLDDAPGDSIWLKGEGLSVASLVDRLIRQAICDDNLCKMFEGWSAWV